MSCSFFFMSTDMRHSIVHFCCSVAIFLLPSVMIAAESSASSGRCSPLPSSSSDDVLRISFSTALRRSTSSLCSSYTVTAQPPPRVIRYDTIPDAILTCDQKVTRVRLIDSTEHTHTQPFNGHWSGTTRLRRYQKKHSSTHPLTPILVIGHPLSASSIYYDP